MAGKDLTELAPTDSITNGDLLLVRKADLGTDKKINYQDFVKSIGNPGVEGFTAISDSENKVKLSAANGAIIPKYYAGMKISFFSPIDSTGLVTIQIGSLPEKELLKQANTTATLKNNSYIEAVLVGDASTGKFYQTNDYASQNIYSNEFSATATIATDQITTTLTLTSAIGLPKFSYYTGMSLLFISPVDSKGAVLVNVDGLGLKQLNEGADDFIANDLVKGQAILATYDGTQFIKHRFAVENAAIAIADQPLPDGQYHTVLKVGAGQQHTTIGKAIEYLIQEYGANGGNRKVNIELQSNFTITNTVYINNQHLDWITITSVDQVKYIVTTTSTDADYCFKIVNSTSPIFKFKLVSSVAFPSQKHFFHITKSKLTIVSSALQDTYTKNRLITANSSEVSIRDTTILGFNNLISVNSDSILNCSNVQANEFLIGGIYSRESRINLTGCTFSSTVNTGRVFESTKDSKVEVIDSIFKGANSQVVWITESTNNSFTNCTVTLPTDGQGFIASIAQVTLDGGDYRTVNSTVDGTQGIIASGANGYAQTIIRLRNSPKGKSTVGPYNSQIINI